MLKAPSLTRIVKYVEAVINGRQTFAPLEAVLTGIRIVAVKQVNAIKVLVAKLNLVTGLLLCSFAHMIFRRCHEIKIADLRDRPIGTD